MDKEYNKKWHEDEWKQMQQKLQLLSVEELLQIADMVGIHFVDKNFNDKPYISAKEQIILTFDEAIKEELLCAYNKVGKKS